MPAQRGGGVGDGGDGVAAVVLAIPIGAQAVLPGFAPVDAGQRHHDPTAQCVAPACGMRRGAVLEDVIVAQVVMDAGGQAGQSRADQITLGRMQVATRWVTAQRPARAGVLLPGRQAQRQLEQDRQRVAFERVSGWPFAAPHGRKRGRQGIGPQRQFDARRSAEPAKRLRLVGSVESARTGRVAVQVVLARLVVGDHPREGVGVDKGGFHARLFATGVLVFAEAGRLLS